MRINLTPSTELSQYYCTLKLICKECYWKGLESEVLHGTNPFTPEPVMGCPKCKSVNPFVVACDEPDCWREVSCGTPTKDGYRNTCGEHAPPLTQEEYERLLKQHHPI